MNAIASMLSQEEVIATSKHIEPLPASVTRLVGLLSDPNASLGDFARSDSVRRRLDRRLVAPGELDDASSP